MLALYDPNAPTKFQLMCHLTDLEQSCYNTVSPLGDRLPMHHEQCPTQSAAMPRLKRRRWPRPGPVNSLQATFLANESKSKQITSHWSQFWKRLDNLHLPASSQWLDEYRRAQAQDHICSSVINFCQNDWPGKEINTDIKPYWNAQGELTVHQGFLLYGNRIIFQKLSRRTHSRKFTKAINV